MKKPEYSYYRRPNETAKEFEARTKTLNADEIFEYNEKGFICNFTRSVQLQEIIDKRDNI